MPLKLLLVAFALSVLGNSALANSVAFDKEWREQGFLRWFSNEYALRGSQLDVVSDGTISLLWRPVPQNLRPSTKASWRWRVTSSVPPTDLSKKGGDDRNLSLYFVFVDAETAAKLTRNNARRVLRNSSTRALVYVWGGTQAKGTVIPSPYNAALRTVVLQNATSGSFTERVNLERDYQRAFGAPMNVLVGLAISADSDDTDSLIRASIADLQLR